MPRKKPLPTIYPDSLRPPQALPDAKSVADMGFPPNSRELDVIRMAMAIHTASKQPKLTWRGWRHIATACAIGSDHAKKAAGGRMDSPYYRQVMSKFLRNTGFQFLNKDDRAKAVSMLPKWDEIDAWRESLPPARQKALNNPREVWTAYTEDLRAIGDPDAKERPWSSRAKRQFPSLLEQMEALAEQLEMAEERAERAERESTYFATMMQAVAEQAKLSEEDVAAIRARIRQAHEEAPEEEEEPE